MNCYGVMPQAIKKLHRKTKEGGGWGRPKTYVGDDAMKRALCVAKSVLSRRELAEVLRCAWYHVIEQAEYDPASRFRVDRYIELRQKHGSYQQAGCKTRIMVRTNTFALFHEGL